MNYSQALRYVRTAIDPIAQIRPHNGGYRVFALHGRERRIYGEGASILGAVLDCFHFTDATNASASEEQLANLVPALDEKFSALTETKSESNT